MMEKPEEIALSPEDQIKFAEMLINPPEPNDALRRAFAMRNQLIATEFTLPDKG